MANEFLRQAKELTTPRKDEKVEVKVEANLTPQPVSAKKSCTHFERWLKKQSGDVSIVRDTRLFIVRGKLYSLLFYTYLFFHDSWVYFTCWVFSGMLMEEILHQLNRDV